MRRVLFAMLAVSLAAPAAERKPLPGQAGNDDIELNASVLVTHDEIQQALGAELGDGYFLVRLKATPKTEQPLRIGPDDFTMISRKDGQRSQALAPSEIAGNGGALVVKTGQSQGGGVGSQRRRTLGIGGLGGGGSVGNSAGAGDLDTKVETTESKTKDNPLLAVLKEKVLPDKETKEPVEGFLYFPIEGKIKPSDVAILYKGPAGRLIVEFQKAKGGR